MLSVVYSRLALERAVPTSKASGEISKEEAENIIAGIAIYDDEDFDEPEYDEEGHVTGVASEASSASPERKAKSTPEELAAKKVRKVFVEVAVPLPLGMAAYPWQQHIPIWLCPLTEGWSCIHPQQHQPHQQQPPRP